MFPVDDRTRRRGPIGGGEREERVRRARGAESGTGARTGAAAGVMATESAPEEVHAEVHDSGPSDVSLDAPELRAKEVRWHDDHGKDLTAVREFEPRCVGTRRARARAARRPRRGRVDAASGTALALHLARSLFSSPALDPRARADSPSPSRRLTALSPPRPQ